MEERGREGEDKGKSWKKEIKITGEKRNQEGKERRRWQEEGGGKRMNEGEEEDQRGMWKMFVGRKGEEERREKWRK